MIFIAEPQTAQVWTGQVLTCRFFSVVNTTTLCDLWLVESIDANCGYRETKYTEVINEFLDSVRAKALTPTLFKGQLHAFICSSID